MSNSEKQEIKEPDFNEQLKINPTGNTLFNENNNEFIEQSNKKRIKSKLWYYITRKNNDFEKSLSEPITNDEIIKAIKTK